MNIYKHTLGNKIKITTHQQYSWGFEVTNGELVAIKELKDYDIYDLYFTGEITFIQCRRLLKQLPSIENIDIANEFKVGNHSNDIDTLTRYYCNARQEREREYQRFLTFVKGRDVILFKMLLDDDRYIKYNEWAWISELTSDAEILNYVENYLKN